MDVHNMKGGKNMKKELVKRLVKSAENYVCKSGSISFYGEVKMPECLRKEVEKKSK